MILIAQVAAAATAGTAPSFTFNPTISLGDVAQALSLPLSLLVAWLTIRSAAKVQQTTLLQTLAEQRSLAFVQDLLGRLTELLRNTNEVAKMVRKNYTKPDAKWKECQVAADTLRRECDLDRDIIAAFLGKTEGDALENAYNKWYDAIFCDAWPNKPNAGAMKSGDTRLKALEDGRLAWSQFIMQMKRDMLKGLEPK